MLKKLIIILLLLLLSTFVFAEKAAALPGPANPQFITVDGSRMFITESTTIYIYSLKDFTLLKKFGKKGEGPQEFKGYAQIRVQPDRLLVNSAGKVSFFTRDGKFIKEIKVLPGSGSAFQGIGDRYVGAKSFMENNTRYRTINIYDSDLKKIKEIYRTEHEFQAGKGMKVFRKSNEYVVFDNKIFLVGQESFVIDVFDFKGNKLYSIKHDFERVKCTDVHRKLFLDFVKKDPRTKNMYEWIKSQVKFPDYFPAISTGLRVTDGKIYAPTFNQTDTEIEFVILDTRGKLLGKRSLELSMKQIFEPYPFTIKNNKVYQLVENEETEEWELHVIKIG